MRCLVCPQFVHRFWSTWMKVSIGVNKGWLRLRWQHEGKPYSMNVGLPDYPTNRAYAQQVAGRIQFDILGNQFDPTLLKYRPQTLGQKATEISCPELFRRFTQHRFKEYGLSPGSGGRYSCIERYLSDHLNVPAHQVSDRTAGNFAAYLTERLSGTTAKSYLYLISACWDWAKGNYRVAIPNPWTGLALKVKAQSQQ